MSTTQSQSASGAVRPAAIVAFGIATASIALVSIVALGGLGGRGGDGGVVAPPPSASPSAPAVTPTPSRAPTAAPTGDPTTPPTKPTAPPDGGSDALPIKVDLKNATGADVHVDIVDNSGLLVDAASGTPGDGASVEGYAVKVENVDARTLKLTWTDFPIDNALALYIDRVDGKIRLLLVQPQPTSETDAIGFDRELVLTFVEPISASRVDSFLQDGLDTPG